VRVHVGPTPTISDSLRVGHLHDVWFRTRIVAVCGAVIQVAHFRESNTQTFGQGEIKLLLLRVNQSLTKGQKMSSIKFDQDAIRRLCQQVASQVAPAAQQSVEKIRRQRSGKSVQRVMSELRSELQTSIVLSDQELRIAAESIASGQRVTVRGG